MSCGYEGSECYRNNHAFGLDKPDLKMQRLSTKLFYKMSLVCTTSIKTVF